ncbi:hypothetical protein E3U55_04435 [Filobacillus milosensis]|uniref:Uncharacterized protein n=1 Tax=Filobacillus milosensis TaxID=94137 RepID=A0A4Y8IXG4_9BACI|nr:hypothetical protein E3U55_04435 [Filobacillus milosensis]
MSNFNQNLLNNQDIYLLPLDNYVLIGFVMIWFVTNASILRLNNWKHILFLFFSILIMLIIPTFGIYDFFNS